MPFPPGGECDNTGQTARRNSQQRLRIAAAEALMRVTGMRDRAVAALATIRDDTEEVADNRNRAEQALARIAAEGL
jgi:hypothetical protein